MRIIRSPLLSLLKRSRFARLGRPPASLEGASCRRVLLECTQTYYAGGNSGIQRVTRNLVNHSLGLDFGQVEVVPVVWAGDGFRQTRQPLRIRSHFIYKVYCLLYQLRNQGHLSPAPDAADDASGSFDEAQPIAARAESVGPVRRLIRRIVRPCLVQFISLQVGPAVRLGKGDVFVLLDSTWAVPPMLDYVFAARERHAFQVGAMIHDLFPLVSPEICESNTRHGYRAWFHRVIPSCDFVITNSATTRDVLWAYLASTPGIRTEALPCSPFTLGAELDAIRSRKKDHGLLDQIWSTPGQAILALGTIEPRKNYIQILDAFDALLSRGLDVSLIIIGKPGWMSDGVMTRLTTHPDFGHRLLYLANASDFVVANAFQRSDCLVCASLSEGFGLPLVEGLMHGCRVFASDIKVFREIGASFCQFFSLQDPDDLPRQLEEWFRDQYSGNAPSCGRALHWPEWSESTRQFVSRTLELVADGEKFVSAAETT